MRGKKGLAVSGEPFFQMRRDCFPVSDTLLLVHDEALLSQFHALVKQLNGQFTRDYFRISTKLPTVK
jgi:hypothetical protein